MINFKYIRLQFTVVWTHDTDAICWSSMDNFYKSSYNFYNQTPWRAEIFSDDSSNCIPGLGGISRTNVWASYLLLRPNQTRAGTTQDNKSWVIIWVCKPKQMSTTRLTKGAGLQWHPAGLAASSVFLPDTSGNYPLSIWQASVYNVRWSNLVLCGSKYNIYQTINRVCLHVSCVIWLE